MSRETKKFHQDTALALATGERVSWKALFQSPTVITEHGGRTRPTVAEYYKIKMGRRQMSEGRLDTKIELRRIAKCQHRRRTVRH